MSWREVKPMDQRVLFINDYLCGNKTLPHSKQHELAHPHWLARKSARHMRQRIGTHTDRSSHGVIQATKTTRFSR